MSAMTRTLDDDPELPRYADRPILECGLDVRRQTGGLGDLLSQELILSRTQWLFEPHAARVSIGPHNRAEGDDLFGREKEFFAFSRKFSAMQASTCIGHVDEHS
jgi:hypothetical protein